MKTAQLENLEDVYKGDPVKACRIAVRRTAKIANIEERAEAINKMLRMYGVESIRGEYVSYYWQDCNAIYCNAGDTYNVTVIFPTRSGKPYIGTWGDWVERNGQRLGII